MFQSLQKSVKSRGAIDNKKLRPPRHDFNRLAQGHVDLAWWSIATYSWFATSLNVCVALLPIKVMAERQTTTIRASITAYSTAVGPSSDFRKRCTFRAKFFMASLQCDETARTTGKTRNINDERGCTSFSPLLKQPTSHTLHSSDWPRRDTCSACT